MIRLRLRSSRESARGSIRTPRLVRPLARAHASTRAAPRSPALSPTAQLPCLLLCLLWLLPGAASAQHDGEVGNAPPPPAGVGRLTVQVLRPSDPGRARGLPIALYALAPDGTPGLARGETDAEGRHVFTGLSTDPDIVYLIGARFREIPFGERVTFAPGEQTARVEIEVAAPTDRIEGVRVEELRARVDWMGDRLVVQEVLRVVNPGDGVVLLDAPDDPRAIVARPLPDGATDFASGSTAIGEGIVERDGVMHFRGPLYPGEQQIDYRYSLPLEPGSRLARLPIELREGATRLVLVAGTPGMQIEGAGLVASQEVLSDAGRPLTSWARAELDPGRRVEPTIELPEIRRSPELISMPRSDVWLELDDTRLTATVNVELEVPAGAPVAGTPEAPLFHVSIPPGARLGGVDAAAERLGLVPSADGGFDVIGPIGPDATGLGYSFQMPAGPRGVDLAMRFPKEVATLNVLIADTGLALESSRLHRRRPFRSGTRNYLHREAFNVSPEETVDLSLSPLRGDGLPRSASIALTLIAAAGAALFLSAPLRSRARRSDEGAPDLTPIQAEREAVYANIADLDHDFETGKLEQADYQQMRSALRARAIDLLRTEREAPRPEARDEPGAPGAAGDAAGDAAGAGDALPTGAFCPACGKRVKPEWRFCSSCGEGLEPDPGEERG